MKQDYYDQILFQAARQDPQYQRLLARCREVEAEYREILRTLSANQQAVLETYAALTAELGHRMTWLALELPRE